MSTKGFLPCNNPKQYPGEDFDIILITGDAYIDHPSFGTAVIARVLDNAGYKVAIIAQPEWKDLNSIKIFGRPKLFFGVSGGNIDSMLARYTARKKVRNDDPYSEGGIAGKRPDRAVIQYCNLIKQSYKDATIVLGGIEASMRRIAHYDYWSGKVRRNILKDSRADILVYGMGEKAILEIAGRVRGNKEPDGISGTTIISRMLPDDAQILPDEESVIKDKDALLEMYRLYYKHRDEIIAQKTDTRFLIHYPSQEITSGELDKIFDLPYMRAPHPIYQEKIPAFEMIKNSVISHRGCVSGCSFCSLGLHQGKKIVSRSEKSILREVESIAGKKWFKGHITDIGGPSANMYGIDCKRKWKCSRESCLFPVICPNLILNEGKWIDVLDKAGMVKGVKHVTVGSGLRYDIIMKEKNSKVLLGRLIKNHISGQLKIAPESVNPKVLRAMRKKPVFPLTDFIRIFRDETAKAGKKQYLLPYFMTRHPGSGSDEKAKKDINKLFGFVPKQMQQFIPLPMTLSSIIYYTGKDPLSGENF